jgi:Protein of unknown function (DUF429)
MQLIGVDFSSAPSAKKPVVVARGECRGSVLRLTAVQALPQLAGFEALLAEPGPWLGAFDFPFGLPRSFVEAQQLGSSAREVIEAVHARCATRMAFRALVDTWGNTQPAGQRLIHRATDRRLPGISSTSPLQTRYVPVGFMYYEGFSRLVRAGAEVPGLVAGDTSRTALEGYPGLLAHELIGRRSYKNDAGSERLLARKEIVEALEQGRTRLALRLKLTPAQAGEVVADASGDRLDAVLCLVQAAWAATQPRFGLPAVVDAVEGWIATSPAPAT